MADEIRYVDIQGRVKLTVEKDPDTKEDVIKMTFLDKEFKPIPGLKPLTFYPSDTEFPFVLWHVHVTAAFCEEGFENDKATLNEMVPFLGNWVDQDLLDVNKMPTMSTSGVPRPPVVKVNP